MRFSAALHVSICADSFAALACIKQTPTHSASDHSLTDNFVWLHLQDPSGTTDALNLSPSCNACLTRMKVHMSHRLHETAMYTKVVTCLGYMQQRWFRGEKIVRYPRVCRQGCVVKGMLSRVQKGSGIRISPHQRERHQERP